MRSGTMFITVIRSWGSSAVVPKHMRLIEDILLSGRISLPLTSTRLRGDFRSKPGNEPHQQGQHQPL